MASHGRPQSSAWGGLRGRSKRPVSTLDPSPGREESTPIG